MYRALASPVLTDGTKQGLATFIPHSRKVPNFSVRHKELLLSICYCYVRRLCRAILIQSYHNFCIHESLVYKYKQKNEFPLYGVMKKIEMVIFL